jgi:hypothetical protein
MAGNLQADNSGNILVEFDYNNLIVVDPNKTIDAMGNTSERLVDHENLVMYANLEAELIPRTKLAVGGVPGDRIRTISVAKINFLKPTKNSYLGTGYYDQLTGENSTKYQAVNQPKEIVRDLGNNQSYIQSTVADEQNVIDNGLLGITSINITTNSSFIPSVKISLEDVQGQALFQLGDNSPYAAFFNLPYCPFYLTLKGYFGQAVRYQLNLEKFNARFNSFSGNYQIELEFRGYKFNILNEIALGHLLAAPHMYSQTFNIQSTPVTPQSPNASTELSSKAANAVASNNSNSKTTTVASVVSEKGYQKIVEVYSEYKAKGLISPNLPELTLVQLMNKLETFETNLINSYPKANLEPLTNIRTYKDDLKKYFNQIRGGQTSWFNTYINPRPLVLENGSQVYAFKQNLDSNAMESATSELKNYVTSYNTLLDNNKTLGGKGTSPLKNTIKYETLEVQVDIKLIDWTATTREQYGIILPTSIEVERTRSQFKNLTQATSIEKTQNNQLVLSVPKFFVFSGTNRFDTIISSLETQANKKLSDFEASISADLARRLEDSASGIGFKPTVRNIIAVIMASAEGFIRLLDDVHSTAWNVKYDPVRKQAILDNPSSALSTDSTDDLKVRPQSLSNNSNYANSQIPVYPWPQFFVETDDYKKGRFQLKYIADPSVVNLTQGWNYAKWPEVEFVEEYMRGLTQKFNPPLAPQPLDNQVDTNLININAIEYPQTGIAYVNKEEIKFFYEIWERQFLTSHYSGLNRANQQQVDKLITLNIETETNNIVKSVKGNAPYLSLKLKNYDLTASNYPNFLNNISNQGTGRAYQDFIRDFFVTPYIKNITENSFSILSATELGKIPQSETKSDALLALLKNASNTPLIVDTVPFTDPSWVGTHMSSSNKSQGNQVYNTNNTLKISQARNLIANFSDVYDYNVNRPVTNFSYLNVVNPTIAATTSLSSFYFTRKPDEFIPTEGYINAISKTKNLPERTTTSILNSPYFVNAIQNGVLSNRKKELYPYVQAAYLFVNSLPLASLRERYKTYNGTSSSDLDYIASCFKKFGAIHKMPYAWVLKFGSIWHRYKKYKDSGVDILTTAWTDFDYVNNYSPIQKVTNQTYSFTYNNVPKSITLKNDSTNSISVETGFYPKLINDFNYFYKGYDLYVTYSNIEIQQSVNQGLQIYNFEDSNIIGAVQGTKSLNVKTWSVLIPDNVIGPDVDCNTSDNTTGTDYYVVPSFGSNINQTKDECLVNQTSTVNVDVNISDNVNMYNGSVRSLWAAPNYGYFNSNELVKPSPESYVNFINTGDTQSPFELLNKDNYSSIEEVFSVFEKKILDQFEETFLNWCKPVTNADSGIQTVSFGQTPTNTDALYRNFQGLYRSLMSVSAKPSSTVESSYFNDIIPDQLSTFKNGIKSFMEYDVILRYGNPSNYKRRVFDSYLSYGASSLSVVDPIKFEPYVVNTLPTKTTTITLTQSKTQNAAAWIALETEVGFSTIPNLVYSSTGSYITDFFVDSNIAFTSQNVILLAPLVKMYATQKLYNPSLNASQFKSQLEGYLDSMSVLQDNFLTQILAGVRAQLPNQEQLPEKTIQSVIDGQQSKVENYEVFKALNDKWIAGSDYKTKTLFEDMMFLDRASRNIGDTILIDIFDLKNMLSENSLNAAMSVFTYVSGILIKNNFTVMNLPAYVNFYNIQDVDGTTTPSAEGSLEFANSMWGTFLDVDYRKSGPKMVCFYVGKPSNYLALAKKNSRFRDDGFELRRASDNPLIENQQGKTDWALSNKCVGFNVDIGIRSQNIFYSFSVSQDSGKATSESINAQLNMVDQASGRNVATQNNSLYNFYKERSYQCTVVSLGNALLQPTMYFNLRHVPMFNGPYMITQVDHSIQPGNFQTTFTGIRQSVFDLPSIDNFLQQINQNLLTKIEELLKVNKDEVRTDTATTNNVKSTEIVQSANNTKATPESCKGNLNAYYSEKPQYLSVDATLTQITPTALATALLNASQSPEVRAAIYCISYVRTYQVNAKTDGKFNGWNNNFGGVSLAFNWGGSNTLISNNYSCVNVTTTASKTMSQPLANFDSLEKYIQFMIGRITPVLGQINNLGLVKYYATNWPSPNVSSDYYSTHVGEFDKLTDTFYKALKSAVSVGVLTIDEGKNLGVKIDATIKQGSTPGVTPTPTPLKPLPGNSCPPPTITSFAPTTGIQGSIIQINGRNIEAVTGITLSYQTLKVLVLPKDITVLNNQTLRFICPAIPGTVSQNVKITLGTENGAFTSTSNFVYNPALTSAASTTSAADALGTTTTTNTTVTQPLNTINTQPGSTGPAVLLSQEDFIFDGKYTGELTVSVNPQAGVWVMDEVVMMIVSVFNKTTVNNVQKETLARTVEYPITSYVKNNVFKLTYSDVGNLLINYPIPPFKEIPLKGAYQTTSIKLVIKARPADKVKYPQDVSQSFSFKFAP